MTTQQIQNRLDAIKEASVDPEMAHGLEDKLMKDFIEYVSERNISLSALSHKAELILTVNEIDFPRRCA